MERTRANRRERSLKKLPQLVRTGARRNDPDRTLTEQEFAFVKHRATGLGKVASARAAGYADPNGQAGTLERRPHVAKAIAIEQAAYAKQAQCTRQEIIDGLRAAIEQAVLLADPMAQIAGWRELAKVCGHYAPEVKEVRLSTDAQKLLTRFESMSDEDLAQLAEKEPLDGEYQTVN